jgi:hypothetical protein
MAADPEFDRDELLPAEPRRREEPEELGLFRRERTTLKVNVLSAELGAPIVFLASSRAGKSTGSDPNLDGGVIRSYRR